MLHHIRSAWLLTSVMLLLGFHAVADEKNPPSTDDLLKEAADLRKRSAEQFQANQFAEAARTKEQQIAVLRKLYPKGHANLVVALHDLGVMSVRFRDYSSAERAWREAFALADAMKLVETIPQIRSVLLLASFDYGRLLMVLDNYQEATGILARTVALSKSLFPEGHPSQPEALNELGFAWLRLGDIEKGGRLYRESLAINRVLYGKNGADHAKIAHGLNQLGSIDIQRGDFSQAEISYRESLAMYRRLYPVEKYPDGHQAIATVLGHLANVRHTVNDEKGAVALFREQYAMLKKIASPDKNPENVEVSECLLSLGSSLKHTDPGEAERTVREAIAIRTAQERVHPRHTDNSFAMRAAMILGMIQQSVGRYEDARAEFAKAIKLGYLYYPREKYPDGSSTLAAILLRAGLVDIASGKHQEAIPRLAESARMSIRLSERMAASAPENEALNMASITPRGRDGYLTATRGSASSVDDAYDLVWRSKAVMMRVYERRHLASATSPEVRALWDLTVKLRRQREQLLLGGTAAPDRERKLRSVSEELEQTERTLLDRLPSLRQADVVAKAGPNDLRAKLPTGTVLIDLLRYVSFEQEPKIAGEKGAKFEAAYVAFVVTPTAVRRVELGSAARIDKVISDWRAAITERVKDLQADQQRERDAREQRLAADLRLLVWKPLEAQIPARTRSILIAPDGALTQVPWAAIPAAEPGRVLLEDYALAVVPHAPFLLSRLTANNEILEDRLLAVGKVAYSETPTTTSPDDLPIAATGKTDLAWPALPGSALEIDRITQFAKGASIKATRIEEANASVASVLKNLSAVSYAHLATHGFFADKEFRSVLHLDEKQFATQISRTGAVERVGPGARSPLVLSGLVLAGANRADTPGRGILTADAIVGLRLDSMKLCVLSACETGLGEVGAGEGVYGLQRAFHLAGCTNVIASQWKVNDAATAALMTKFYHELWINKKPPIEALREAQLMIYRRPDLIPDLAGERGAPNLKKAVEVKSVEPIPKELMGKKSADTKLWAAFVLSGVGK